MAEKFEVEAVRVTEGKYHWFGYYDKFPWDASGRYLLGMESPFMDRQPDGSEPAVIGMIDLHDGNRWIPLDETLAWCWQQGTMLQWLPSAPDRKIIYNQRQGDRFVSVIRDVFSGETITLPRPIYCVSPDGRSAITLNYARLNRRRPGYGYPGVVDAWAGDPHPVDDGIFWMNLETGENRLIISYDQIRHLQPKETMAAGQHWFNHLTFAPDGARFVFLHRWQHDNPSPRKWLDRFISAQPDGNDIWVVADHDFISHFDWYSPTRILAWANHYTLGMHYLMYTDRTAEVEVLGKDVFFEDGHCSFSPDRQWMMTDTYPDSEDKRTLILYHMTTGRRIDIGKFYAPPQLEGPLRCDLHPRWSRDGQQVCIDSAHEGSRQMYVLNVAPIIRSL